jgi:hypothetical protein
MKKKKKLCGVTWLHCISFLFPAKALEIPKHNDDGVVEAMKLLNRQLRPDLMKNSLKDVGELLHLATGAKCDLRLESADASKLSDVGNQVLSKFKVASGVILEKLHIAFMKLLDGFPDLSLNDMELVFKQIITMKATCKKANDAFSTAKKELEKGINSLVKEEFQLGRDRTAHLQDYKEMMNRIGERSCSLYRYRACSLGGPSGVLVSSVRQAYRDTEGPRDRYHEVSKKIPACHLATEALRHALPKLNDAMEFLERIERLADDWYKECWEVIASNINGVQQVEEMSENKQKEITYNCLCR